MLATDNSHSENRGDHVRPPAIRWELRGVGLLQGRLVLSRRFFLLTAWVFILGVRPVVRGAESPSPAVRAEQAFTSAKTRFRDHGNEADAAAGFAHACFDWAEFAKNREQRAEIAQQGIAAAKAGLSRKPDSAECHYFLALNFGQLARTRHIGALKLVREMEREFKTAIGLDEKIDFGGPRRSLGLLYRDAPGWPASIGNRSHARTELERAVALFPDYPDNRLSLAESCLKWGDKHGLDTQVKTLKQRLPTARAKWTGEQWGDNWIDWDARWKKLLEAADREAEKKSR